MGVVVDTSALVAAERRRESDSSGTLPTWSELLGRLADENAVLPAATYAELLVGVHWPTHSDGPRRVARESTPSPPACR